MNTAKIIGSIVAIVAALTAAGLTFKILSKKKNQVVQKGNKLDGGSQMAGRDINN
jgi:hypothetical protein